MSDEISHQFLYILSFLMPVGINHVNIIQTMCMTLNGIKNHIIRR